MSLLRVFVVVAVLFCVKEASATTIRLGNAHVVSDPTNDWAVSVNASLEAGSVTLNNGKVDGVDVAALKASVDTLQTAMNNIAGGTLGTAFETYLMNFFRPVLTTPAELDAQGRLCRLNQIDRICTYQFQATDPHGDAPLSYELVYGSLPGDVTLNATGYLNGSIVAPHYQTGPFYNTTVGIAARDPSGLLSAVVNVTIEIHNFTIPDPIVYQFATTPSGKSRYHSIGFRGSLFSGNKLDLSDNVITFAANEDRRFLAQYSIDRDTKVLSFLGWFISGTGQTLNLNILNTITLDPDSANGLQHFYTSGDGVRRVRGVEMKMDGTGYVTTTSNVGKTSGNSATCTRISDTTGYTFADASQDQRFYMFSYAGGGTLTASAVTSSIPIHTGRCIARLWDGTGTNCDRGSATALTVAYWSSAWSAATTTINIRVYEWSGVNGAAITETTTASFITLPDHTGATVMTPELFTASFGHVLVHYDDATPANQGFYIFTMSGNVPDPYTFVSYTGSIPFSTFQYQWRESNNRHAHICGEMKNNDFFMGIPRDNGSGDTCADIYRARFHPTTFSHRIDLIRDCLVTFTGAQGFETVFSKDRHSVFLITYTQEHAFVEHALY